MRYLRAAALGLGVAAIAGAGLPSTAFRARAVVAVTDIASPLSAILPRAAADASVSEPVIRRAAQSLIETNSPVPAPNVVEQIAVAIGMGAVHATGQEARLAADLAAIVTAKPGDVPGSLEIAAASPDAARAAQIATAVAEALVADQDDMAAQARRRREIEAISVVERFKAQAAAARRRLTDLGGAEADPTQIRAAAAAQAANAQARVDAIRAIIASSTPPLSDRRDVPSGIEALQTTYLDATRQLAKARETLGDRHTTVISLQDEVRHAAANLTTEWRRLAHLAEADLSTARQREAMLRKADTPADATRRAAIEEARRSVQIADEAVVRVQTAQHETPVDERSYRLMARANTPAVANGFGAITRALMAGLLGLLGFWAGLRLPALPAAARLLARVRAERDARREEPTIEAAEQPAARRPEALAEAADVALRRAMKRRDKSMGHPRDADDGARPDEDLTQSLADLLPGLDEISPAYGNVATVMVAANEAAAGTMPVALAFGRAAVDVGYRVLVVETARGQGVLTTAADSAADPVLIDLFGVLRVALPAESANGCLYLAPSLEHGARIASGLARQSETPLVDDLGAEFDLIVIDGARAADSAAAGWGADAYIRVGRFASDRDDDQFAATFGVSTLALLGTIVASVFAPKAQRKPVRPAAMPVGAKPPHAVPRTASHGVAAPSRVVPIRPAPHRRTVTPRFGATGR